MIIFLHNLKICVVTMGAIDLRRSTFTKCFFVCVCVFITIFYLEISETQTYKTIQQSSNVIIVTFGFTVVS